MFYYIHLIQSYSIVFNPISFKRKNEDFRLRPMTKAPKPTEKSKQQSDNTKTPSKLQLHNDWGLA